MAWAWWQRLKRQWSKRLYGGCSCFCPGCKDDLTVSTASVTYDSHGFVLYHCPCGTRSGWDFDLPVPVRVYTETRS